MWTHEWFHIQWISVLRVSCLLITNNHSCVRWFGLHVYSIVCVLSMQSERGHWDWNTVVKRRFSELTILEVFQLDMLLNVMLIIHTYFICLTIVLFPDSPAPETEQMRQKKNNLSLQSHDCKLFYALSQTSRCDIHNAAKKSSQFICLK